MNEISKRGLSILIFLVIFVAVICTYVIFEKSIGLRDKVALAQQNQRMPQASVNEAPMPKAATGILTAEVVSAKTSEANE